VGTSPPGDNSANPVQGARPQWVGALKASDYRPDVPCASQPLPSLASPTAASDLHSVRSAQSPSPTDTSLRTLISRVDRQTHR
jgi:hypothetical protein